MFTNKPNRLQGYNYSRDNYYFVTSVVKNRFPYLGTINDGEMMLNEFGQIVLKQLRWLAQQYPYVRLHEHIVMPDHIHAIIEINCCDFDKKIKSISELMGAFKTTSCKQIRLHGLNEFQWQTSFHDRIIRNKNENMRIGKYITDNPKNYYSELPSSSSSSLL